MKKILPRLILVLVCSSIFSLKFAVADFEEKCIDYTKTHPASRTKKACAKITKNVDGSVRLSDMKVLATVDPQALDEKWFRFKINSDTEICKIFGYAHSIARLDKAIFLEGERLWMAIFGEDKTIPSVEKLYENRVLNTTTCLNLNGYSRLIDFDYTDLGDGKAQFTNITPHYFHLEARFGDTQLTYDYHAYCQALGYYRAIGIVRKEMTKGIADIEMDDPYVSAIFSGIDQPDAYTETENYIYGLTCQFRFWLNPEDHSMDPGYTHLEGTRYRKKIEPNL